MNYVESTNKKAESAPFCVLEPMPDKTAHFLKLATTRDLPLLANKLQERQ